MMNAIWLAMIVGAIVCGAVTGRLDLVAKASTESATGAVTLAISLVGVMTLWLGLMRILQDGGVLRAVARGLRPVMSRLFPEVPAEHPATSMMIVNFTSNMLGLTNAATPSGIKAMIELDKLNPHKGTASDAMALFLAINTTNLALLPTGMITLRAALGSSAPGAIFLPTLLATCISTMVGILMAKLMVRLGVSPLPKVADAPRDAERASDGPDVSEALALVNKEVPPPSRARRMLGWGLALVVLVSFAVAIVERSQVVVAGAPVGLWGALKVFANEWTLVVLIAAFVLYGAGRGVRVYESLVEGGKEGFSVAVRIIPYLVAILVGVGMLRASGAIELFVAGVGPLTELVGFPAETLPMALMRPLSGSGAYGLCAEIMKTHGPDSLIGTIVSTMNGSSETTFYVAAVYFGAVNVRRLRYTLVPCLVGDAAGLISSVYLVRWILF